MWHVQIWRTLSQNHHSNILLYPFAIWHTFIAKKLLPNFCNIPARKVFPVDPKRGAGGRFSMARICCGRFPLEVY
jgi:hypothetical protein